MEKEIESILAEKYKKRDSKLLRKLKMIVKDIVTSTYYRTRKHNNNIDYNSIKSITFLCYGNICRSPFCEYYLKKLIENKKQIEIYSAGFIMKEGRLSPENAQKAAEKFKIDLSNHRSRTITEQLAINSSIIIGMNYNNYVDFKRFFPAYANKFYLLKSLVKPKKFILNIQDPYGKSIDEFSKCYLDIKENIDLIFDRRMKNK